MKFYFVYIVECSDNSFYIGITSDLERRINEHNIGTKKESYTFFRRPVELKWLEQFTEPNEAIKVEKQLKGWSRKKKIALINEDWEKLVLYSRNYSQYGSSTGSD